MSLGTGVTKLLMFEDLNKRFASLGTEMTRPNMLKGINEEFVSSKAKVTEPSKFKNSFKFKNQVVTKGCCTPPVNGQTPVLTHFLFVGSIVNARQ